MPASDLVGQVALVTGGGKGVGAAIARSLSARGVAVVVTGRDEHALARVVGEIAAAGGKARHLAGDVRDVAHLEAAVEKTISVFGSLDIIVSSARQSGRFELGTDLDRARSIFDTNVSGAYSTFHAAIRKMKGPGRLIAITSSGVAGLAATRASAAGIVGMMGALAEELAPRKITCNAICLADTATSMPVIEPEEVAELVAFLCARAADETTGQALTLGGGSR